MSLNKVMLIGNVGKDPEVRYIDSGVCTAQIALATSTPGYTLPNGTNVPERTEWHNICLWRRLAEVAERYVHKGDKLYIEGELRYRSYTDKKGLTHKVAEIWATNMEMLTPRNPNTTPSQSATQSASQPTPSTPFPPSENNAGATNTPVNGNASKCPF